MEPIEAYLKIRSACERRPDLRFKDTVDRNDPRLQVLLRPMQGFCYVASNAFALVVPEARVWKGLNGSHYWNKIGDQVWDLTAEQFNYPFPYKSGVKTRKKLSNRVEELLKEADLWF